MLVPHSSSALSCFLIKKQANLKFTSILYLFPQTGFTVYAHDFICYLLIFIRMLANCFIISIYQKKKLKFREDNNYHETTQLRLKFSILHSKEFLLLISNFLILITIFNSKKVTSSSHAHRIRTFVQNNAMSLLEVDVWNKKDEHVQHMLHL